MENEVEIIETVEVKKTSNKPARILAVLLFAGMVLTGTASADLAGQITNLTTVVTAVVDWITDIMAVFMEAPLVIFVGMTIAGRVISKVKSLMGM